MGKVVRVLYKTVRITAAVLLAAVLLTYRDLTGIFVDSETYRSATCWIVIHHDAVNRPVSVKEIQDYHKEVNGWESGFGYNFYLKNGKIYQLHELNACTAHAKYFNCNAVSICIHSEDKHDLRTQINLIVLVNTLKLVYNIDKRNIVGHCELPNNDTQCPELNLEKFKLWILGK